MTTKQAFLKGDLIFNVVPLFWFMVPYFSQAKPPLEPIAVKLNAVQLDGMIIPFGAMEKIPIAAPVEWLEASSASIQTKLDTHLREQKEVRQYGAGVAAAGVVAAPFTFGLSIPVLISTGAMIGLGVSSIVQSAITTLELFQASFFFCIYKYTDQHPDWLQHWNCLINFGRSQLGKEAVAPMSIAKAIVMARDTGFVSTQDNPSRIAAEVFTEKGVLAKIVAAHQKKHQVFKEPFT